MSCMKTQNQPDAHLLISFSKGDRHAFEVLYTRYWESLFKTASRIMNDTEIARDVVQDVFVSLYERKEEIRILNVNAYLFQCVKLKCFMLLRSGKITEKHLGRINQVMMANVVDEEMSIKELEAALKKEIENLPDKCRQVFYLSRYELQSNQKIAETLNISKKTVEHQITKALKRLRLTVDKLAIIALTAIYF